jgi:hypothetical protein
VSSGFSVRVNCTGALVDPFYVDPNDGGHGGGSGAAPHSGSVLAALLLSALVAASMLA